MMLHSVSWLGLLAATLFYFIIPSYATDFMRHHAHVAKRAITSKANDLQSMYLYRSRQPRSSTM